MDSKIVVIGDTHSNFQVLEQIIVLEQPVAVIHAGDVGLYDEAWQEKISARDVKKINQHKNPVEQFWPYLLGQKEFPIPMYFIPGNHEDFHLWKDMKEGNVKIRNFIPLDESTIHKIPIGEKEMTCQGLGKILPLRASRKKESYFTDQEYRAFRAKGEEERPDLLIFHEPPYLAGTLRKRSSAFGHPLISAAIQKINPRSVFIGHMHFEYQLSLDKTRIYGLGYGSAGRYAILYPDFSVEFKSFSEMPKLHEVSLKSYSQTEEDLVRNLEALHRPFLNRRNNLPISGQEMISYFPDLQKTELTAMFSELSRAFKNGEIKTKEDCLSFARKWAKPKN